MRRDNTKTMLDAGCSPRRVRPLADWMLDRDIKYQVSRTWPGGTPPGGRQSRLGSGERAGASESIQYPPARKRGCFRKGFALYEVLLGVTVFMIGVLALGRAVENCLNASALSTEEDRVRQILSNRMSEIQATPGIPDAAKEFKIDTGYGTVKLVQKTAPAKLTEKDGTELNGVNVVTLTAQWTRGGVKQAKSIEFYVYRAG